MIYSKEDLEKIMATFGNPKRETFDPLEFFMEKHFVVKDIKCIDYHGRVMESYKELLVPKAPYVAKKNPEDAWDEDMIPMTQAVKKLDIEGKFLPSTALWINVLDKLFSEAVEIDKDEVTIKDKEKYEFVKDVIWTPFPYVMNSIINYEKESIIHYPRCEDIRKHTGYPIPNDFNHDRMTKREGFYTGWSQKIKTGPGFCLNQQSDGLIVGGLMGLWDNINYKAMLKHYKVKGEILLKDEENNPIDVKGIQMSSKIHGTEFIDNMYKYTYCMIPPENSK